MPSKIRSAEEVAAATEMARVKLYELHANSDIPRAEVFRVARKLHDIYVKYADDGVLTDSSLVHAARIAKDFLNPQEQKEDAVRAYDYIVGLAAWTMDLPKAYALYKEAATIAFEHSLGAKRYIFARVMLDPILFHLDDQMSLIRELRLSGLPGIGEYNQQLTRKELSEVVANARNRQAELGVDMPFRNTRRSGSSD